MSELRNQSMRRRAGSAGLRLAGISALAGMTFASGCTSLPRFLSDAGGRNREARVAQADPFAAAATNDERASVSPPPRAAQSVQQAAGHNDGVAVIQQLSHEELEEPAELPRVPQTRPWASDLEQTAVIPSVNTAAIAAAVAHAPCPRVHVDLPGCPQDGCQSPLPGAVGVGFENGRDEYVCDGGDHGLPVHFQRGVVAGLENEDTVATYVDESGRRRVKPSNQVCVYAPRFGVARAVTEAIEDYNVDRALGAHDGVKIAGFTNRTGITERAKIDALSALRTRDRLSGMNSAQQDGEVAYDLKPNTHAKLVNAFQDYAFAPTFTMDIVADPRVIDLMVAANEWSTNQAPRIVAKDLAGQQVSAAFVAEEVVGVEDRRAPGELQLVKLADRGSAKLGDVVSFSLRFSNLGGKPLTDVQVIDNLSPRLELLEETAEWDLEGELEVVDNGRQGTVITFRLAEPLQGQASGVLTFQCRVR
ncbi:MAG: DUF11 domain-containing protein [Planctomyces sp.]|nr:DUF11 domain-containing protein [Planctomyces sp.]